MLHTRVCDLFGIDVPVIQASIGPWSTPELAAAASNAGALGTYGTSAKAPDAVRADLSQLRELTARPFAVNHTLRPFDEETFALSLEVQPAVVSLALGLSRELVERAHAAGARFVQQVITPEQAVTAAEAGADAIIAQGSEAGGFGGDIAAMALIPQVVDAVAPLPVIAAGGIADGRGMAAAFMLGAEGVNIGTRFLASTEAGISEDWQRRIVEALSEDAVKVTFSDAVFPPGSPGAFEVSPRALRTPFIDEGNAGAADPDRLREELMDGLRAGRAHEFVPFAGQTAGLISDVRPVAQILRELVEGAERALSAAPRAS